MYLYERTCLWYLMLKYGVVGGMMCICWLSLEALMIRCKGTDKLQILQILQLDLQSMYMYVCMHNINELL